VKTVLQVALLKSLGPYLLLYLAGVADLATSLCGVRIFGLTEGNPNFIPFLTEAMLIVYIFVIRRIPVFPKKTKRICETAVVGFSFAPAVWNILLIFSCLLA
jgi:hypothetical protein